MTLATERNEEYGSEHGLPIMAGDSLENELQS